MFVRENEIERFGIVAAFIAESMRSIAFLRDSRWRPGDGGPFTVVDINTLASTYGVSGAHVRRARGKLVAANILEFKRTGPSKGSELWRAR